MRKGYRKRRDEGKRRQHRRLMARTINKLHKEKREKEQKANDCVYMARKGERRTKKKRLNIQERIPW